MSASKSAPPSVDTLSTLERLILAQAVYEFGSSKWDKVATILSTHPLLHRPKNFYTPEVSLVSAIHGSRIPTEIGIVTYRHVIDYSLLSCTMQTLTCERWVGLAPIYHFLLTTYSTARAARTAEEVGVSRQHDVAWYVNICLAPAVLSLAQIHYVARVKEINELLNEEETKFKYVAILFSNILFVHTLADDSSMRLTRYVLVNGTTRYALTYLGYLLEALPLLFSMNLLKLECVLFLFSVFPSANNCKAVFASSDAGRDRAPGRERHHR